MSQPSSERLITRSMILWSGALATCLASVSEVLVSPLAGLATGFLAFAMALIAVVDLRHFIIPDVLSLPAIPAGILASAAIFHADDPARGGAESALACAIAGGVFLAIREIYFRVRGNEGLGLGDVKLAAAAGAWLGLDLLAPATLVAALSALVAVLASAALGRAPLDSRTTQIPFGSFIAPTILLLWLWRLYQPGSA